MVSSKFRQKYSPIWPYHEWSKAEKWQIRAPTKCWIETHHLKGLFLSFQKIIKIRSTVFKLWLLKDVQLYNLPFKIHFLSFQKAVQKYMYYTRHSHMQYIQCPPPLPSTGWVPMCPPGELNPYTTALRDCISVLFMFERKPVQDKEFSNDCRQWLDLLVSL